MRYLQQWKQNGNWRLRFRRPGYESIELKAPPGYRGDKPTLANSQEFLTAYLAAMSATVAPVKPGEKRAAYGTVAWLCVEYLASLDFLGRPKSMRVRHKRYIEDFRARRGEHLVAVVDTEGLEKIFAKMIHEPSKANQWLDAMRDLFKYAIKRKLLAANPAVEIKKRKSNNPDGHHCWTPEEVAKAREKFPIETMMRLAIELMLNLACRRSDVIRVGLPDTYAGHLEDGRPATFLKYMQHKNRERKPITVDTPIPADLLEIIRATRATGLKTWPIGVSGKPFREERFTSWFAGEMAAAGLPGRCTPHGLRKRCLTDLANEGKNIHQIMAVSGHLTMKEVERYTRMADRALNARAAMAGKV